jgi:hypothetical protein
MKVYRIKHIPTDLYFTTSKGNGNLSNKGKLYVDRKPSLKWVETIRVIVCGYKKDYKGVKEKICKHFELDPDSYVDKYFKTKPEDWIIEEVK